MPLTSASDILQPYFSAAFFSSQYIPFSMLFSVCKIEGKASVYYSIIIVLPIVNNVTDEFFVLTIYFVKELFNQSLYYEANYFS